jgi:hypothetical protein
MLIDRNLQHKLKLDEILGTNEWILVVVIRTLLILPNVLLNYVKKSSKSSKRGESFFNNGANLNDATPKNKVPMSLT